MVKFLQTKLGSGRAKFITHMLLIYIIFQAAARVSFFIYSSDVVERSFSELVKTFSLGIFYDLVTGLQALLPVMLLLLCIPAKWLQKRAGKVFLSAAIFALYLLMLFIGISEYLFWDEFQATFNFIAVDYLIYTTEVLGNIKESYNLWLIVPALLLSAGILTYLQLKYARYTFADLNWRERAGGLAAALIMPVLFFNAVDSNWRNLALNNKYNVEIAANGPYEFVSAFFNNELDYEQFYLTQENGEAIAALRRLAATNDARFLDNDSLTRSISSEKPLKTPNIVMIVVESFNADYMTRFGNKGNLTPKLDALAKESLVFTKVYATGTRTVRGLEALSLCVPPTPGQSIVRRPDNNDMFSLGSLLREQGYALNFIYGGYGYFDNMNAFYANNGYNVIDRTDIPKDEIFSATVWGVADEILFAQALKQMDKSFAQKQKSLQIVLTTSNHRPFTYPDERIDIAQGTRNGAVKYTDWAIGDFIAKAKEKEWFKDTIFIIVGDHQAGSAGKVTLPVSKYHIPALVYAPGLIAPGENNRLMSQIDLPPTIFGLLGLSYDSRFMGYDINALEEGRERAFISTYQNLGYIRGDKLVVLKPKGKVEMYRINDFATSEYTAIEPDEVSVKEAVAWYQGASYLYKNKLLKNFNNRS